MPTRVGSEPPTKKARAQHWHFPAGCEVWFPVLVQTVPGVAEGDGAWPKAGRQKAGPAAAVKRKGKGELKLL